MAPKIVRQRIGFTWNVIIPVLAKSASFRIQSYCRDTPHFWGSNTQQGWAHLLAPIGWIAARGRRAICDRFSESPLFCHGPLRLLCGVCLYLLPDGYENYFEISLYAYEIPEALLIAPTGYSHSVVVVGSNLGNYIRASLKNLLSLSAGYYLSMFLTEIKKKPFLLVYATLIISSIPRIILN